MNTFALDNNIAPATTTRREKVAAGLALPIGVMGCIGSVIFWEWSALIFVSVIALGMGIAFLTGAFRVLRGDSAGARVLLATACVQLVFTAAKLAIWHEADAVLFGLVALAIAGLTYGSRR